MGLVDDGDTATAYAQHPVRSIWLRPRSTIRQIVDNDPEYGVFALTALSGAALASLDVVGRWVAGEIPLAVVVVFILIAGPVREFAALYIGGWLLLTVGRWLGGSASSPEVRTAIAWSNFPLLAGVAGVLLLSVLDATSGYMDILAEVVFLLLFLWSLLMLAYCLSAVMRFSLLRSVASMAAAGLLLLTVVAVVMLIAGTPYYMLFEHGLFTMTEAVS